MGNQSLKSSELSKSNNPSTTDLLNQRNVPKQMQSRLEEDESLKSVDIIQNSQQAFQTNKESLKHQSSSTSNSLHQDFQHTHFIQVFYQENLFLNIGMCGTKDRHNKDLTSGWLLNEVVKKLNRLKMQIGKDKIIPVSLSAKGNQSECIDYFLTQGEQALTSFLTFQYQQFNNAFICEQPLVINYAKVNELKLESYNQSQAIFPIPSLLDFDIVKVLGTGGFSQVLMVRKRTSGMLYAMKVINKTYIMDKNKVETAICERKILTMLNHPFIVQLHWAFTSKKYLFLVLDLCPGGELFYYIQKQKQFNEQAAKIFFAEVLLAVEVLHINNIMYRDLKPENILIDQQGHIKLTDFGLSKMNFSMYDTSDSFCGSPEYMSPEMLTNQGHGRQIDIYCLGVLLFELLTGLPPHYNNNRMQMYQDIVTREISFPKYISNEARDLLIKMLEKDPERRICYRLGIKEIKSHPFCADIDWDQILQKKVNPPIKINIYKSNFDSEYTSMNPLQDIYEEHDSDNSFTQHVKVIPIKRSYSADKIMVQEQIKIDKLTFHQKEIKRKTQTRKDINRVLKNSATIEEELKVSPLSPEEREKVVIVNPLQRTLTPTFQEFLYQKYSPKKTHSSQKQLDIEINKDQMSQMQEDYLSQTQNNPSILSENISVMKANISRMNHHQGRLNKIQLLNSKNYKQKLKQKEIDGNVDEIQECTSSESDYQEHLYTNQDDNEIKLPKLEVHQRKKVDESLVDIEMNIHHQSFLSDRSAQNNSKMSQEIEEAFTWHRQIETKKKQQCRFKSPPRKFQSKRSSKILLPNFKQLANFIHRENGFSPSKQQISKKISANLLTFTEKANGVKSERIRQRQLNKYKKLNPMISEVDETQEYDYFQQSPERMKMSNKQFQIIKQGLKCLSPVSSKSRDCLQESPEQLPLQKFTSSRTLNSQLSNYKQGQDHYIKPALKSRDRSDDRKNLIKIAKKNSLVKTKKPKFQMNSSYSRLDDPKPPLFIQKVFSNDQKDKNKLKKEQFKSKYFQTSTYDSRQKFKQDSKKNSNIHPALRLSETTQKTNNNLSSYQSKSTPFCMFQSLQSKIKKRPNMASFNVQSMKVIEAKNNYTTQYPTHKKIFNKVNTAKNQYKTVFSPQQLETTQQSQMLNERKQNKLQFSFTRTTTQNLNKSNESTSLISIKSKRSPRNKIGQFSPQSQQTQLLKFSPDKDSQYIITEEAPFKIKEQSTAKKVQFSNSPQKEKTQHSSFIEPSNDSFIKQTLLNNPSIQIVNPQQPSSFYQPEGEKLSKMRDRIYSIKHHNLRLGYENSEIGSSITEFDVQFDQSNLRSKRGSNIKMTNKLKSIFQQKQEQQQIEDEDPMDQFIEEMGKPQDIYFLGSQGNQQQSKKGEKPQNNIFDIPKKANQNTGKQKNLYSSMSKNDKGNLKNTYSVRRGKSPEAQIESLSHRTSTKSQGIIPDKKQSRPQLKKNKQESGNSLKASESSQYGGVKGKKGNTSVVGRNNNMNQLMKDFAMFRKLQNQ